jgi:hypothetical protein
MELFTWIGKKMQPYLDFREENQESIVFEIPGINPNGNVK